MNRTRRKKVKTYSGISEFAMSCGSYRQGNYVYLYAYNILRPDSWRKQRTSSQIFNISIDGIDITMQGYRANRLNIDIDTYGRICRDGVDFI